jgi:hypothetical protein
MQRPESQGNLSLRRAAQASSSSPAVAAVERHACSKEAWLSVALYGPALRGYAKGLRWWRAKESEKHKSAPGRQRQLPSTADALACIGGAGAVRTVEGKHRCSRQRARVSMCSMVQVNRAARVLRSHRAVREHGFGAVPSAPPNPSIERTAKSTLRVLSSAAHVERSASLANGRRCTCPPARRVRRACVCSCRSGARLVGLHTLWRVAARCAPREVRGAP